MIVFLQNKLLIFKPLFPTRILFQLIPYVSLCELDNLINRVNGAQRSNPIWSIRHPQLAQSFIRFCLPRGFLF